jgi:hypothetical protein
MEDLISDWDMIDIKPKKGKYTWNNKRFGINFTAARLDHFLIHNDLLLLPYSISLHIIPSTTFDHRPISLSPDPPANLSPIPFCFNFAWLLNSDVHTRVKNAWSTYISRSPNFIWEIKLRVVKLALKEWEKSSFVPPHKDREDKINILASIQ